MAEIRRQTSKILIKIAVENAAALPNPVYFAAIFWFSQAWTHLCRR
jgi:hypothetical protein